MSNATNPSSDTIINFYDNYVPSLKDGQYTITLSQAVTAPGVPSSPQQAPATQSFLVNGPRFSLPPADVNHVFPANNSTGIYGTFLPQIVMNEQSLPWERNLALTPLQPNIPWMALLVFSEGELPGPQPPPPAGSQQNPTLISSRLLQDVLTPGSRILGPSLTLEANEDASSIYCNTIDIPVALFNNILPSLNDATFLAHTRQVSLANKAIVPGQTGFFSAVVANRFAVQASAPATMNTNIAHLVSLEGFEQVLSATGQPNVSATTYDFVRMVSLYSWTYNVQSEPAQDFSQLMNNLVSANSIDGTGLLLQMPPPATAPVNPDATTQAVQTRLNDGYVPLSYEMQSGDQTFAWYRGPLSPVPVTRFLQGTNNAAGNPATPFSSADAMIFDANTGIFDQSYSVAFQTGRSLALASQSFATSLVRWRKTSYHLVDLIMEYMTSPVYAGKMVADGLMNADGTLTATGVSDLSHLLYTDVVTGAFTDFFATELYQNIATTIGTKGGFTPADSSQIIEEAPYTAPSAPGDLLTLMQEPVIVNLLQHLSGLDNLGTLSAPLAPAATSISLAAPGVSEALSSGDTLFLYSSAGSAWVTLAADAPVNSTTITISAYNGTVTIPTGSTLQVQDADQDAQTVVSWMASTALLYNVPFNNLVANPAMLPQETIRFFYIDQNWTDALLDGALSIGVQSSRDSLFNQLMRDTLYMEVQQAMAEVRDGLLGVAAQGHTPDITQPAGFLLRSQNIANWPGLQVTAVSATTGNPMNPLRLDNLAGDLLFAIFPDIPTQVVFAQPNEGLVFGMEQAQAGNMIDLRYIPGITGFSASNIGTLTGGSISQATVEATQRAGTTALNIAGTTGLVAAIEAALPGSPTLTPASFAVEMVCVPEQMIFTPLT